MTPTTRIRILWICLASLVVLAGLIAATPYLINTRVVKNQISDQISDWMGLPVTVRGEPIVTVFPYLTIKLKDVEVASNLGATEPPLVSMDVLRAEMYWLPLILGEFQVRRFHLQGPEFYLERRADGSHSWNMSQGTLLAHDIDGEGLNLADISLGRFAIDGGSARIIDEMKARDEKVSDVNLAFAWPSTGRAASIEGGFVWRDEAITLQAESDHPMELLTGGLSPLILDVASRRFNASLEGSAATLADLQLEGNFAFQTPSLSDLLRWLDLDIEAGDVPGAASLTGRANMVGSSASFSDMVLSLDDNRAEGVLQIDLRRERALIQGTLAFDDLNLTPYMQRQGSKGENGQKGATLLERYLSPAQLRELDIDVRLSANRMISGPLQLTQMAASVVTRDRQLSLSIGEAYAYGGRLEADVRMRPSKDDDSILQGTLRAKANGVSAGTFAREMGREPFLTGTALAELDIQGEGKTFRDILRQCSGDLSLVLTEGSLTRFNLDIMHDALQNESDVEPDAIYEGGTAFDVLSVRGQLQDYKVILDGLRLTAGKLALVGSAEVVLENMEMDFPGRLALYESADPTTHATEDPQAQFPFRLLGPIDQPTLAQIAAVNKDNASAQTPDQISVPGVPEGTKAPELDAPEAPPLTSGEAIQPEPSVSAPEIEIPAQTAPADPKEENGKTLGEAAQELFFGKKPALETPSAVE